VGDAPGAPATSLRARAWAFVCGRPLRQIGLALGLLVLLVSGAFGGWARAAPPEVAAPQVGVAHQSAPFTLTLQRARWTTNLGAAGTSERGRYLIVSALLRTDDTTTVPADVVRDAVHLEGARAVFRSEGSDATATSDDIAPWAVLVVTDSTRVDGAAPGLTYEIAWVWEQERAQPAPTEVTVSTRSATHRASTVDGQLGWFDPVLDARGTMPMKESGT
jgi:hypothetical protein